LTFEEYTQLLQEAGFVQVEVLDSGADLNAYALVEGQSGCCSPARPAENSPAPTCSSTGENTSPTRSFPIAEDWIAASQSCCGGSWPEQQQESLAADNAESFHEELAVLLRRYDINDYAASVKVSAVKPG
jgi:hypothetical protein